MARTPRQGPSKVDFLIGSRDYNFQADVDRIIVNTKKRMTLVMRQSLINTINEMQTVGPSKKAIQAAIDEGLGSSGRGKKKMLIQGPITAPGKGGKMRVDTGFLRASGQASLNGMPTGPSDRPKDAAAGQFEWTGKDAESTIGTLQFGSTLYWGWTAKYARVREAYDGFMYSTLQNWQQIVNKVVEEAKARFS